MNTKRNILVFFVLCMAIVVFSPADGAAYSVDVCDGKPTGLRGSHNFYMDRCSVYAGGSREDVLLDSARQWNEIPGTDYMFNMVDGDDDCSSTYDDGYFEIGFNSSSGGLTHREIESCVWPYWSWCDGSVDDIDIFIGDALNLDPSPDTAIDFRARKVTIHELGHALALNHQTSAAIMTQGSRGTLGAHSRTGVYYGETEDISPDEVLFMWNYHRGSGTGNDIAVSGHAYSSGWYTMNTYTQTATRGSSKTYYYRYENLGTNDLTFSGKMYISTNDVISIYDTQVSAWTGAQNTMTWGGTHSKTFTVPTSLSTSRYYYIGVVLDTDDSISEVEEGNNSVLLGRLWISS